MAWWRAAAVLTVAWAGSLLTSLKFDLHIHPSAVVLSVINKAQSPRSRWSASKSIQGVIIAARYHQKQHHVPYSLAILINGIFLLIYGIASTLWAFQYVFSCT
jgi:hypothetical protein